MLSALILSILRLVIALPYTAKILIFINIFNISMLYFKWATTYLEY